MAALPVFTGGGRRFVVSVLSGVAGFVHEESLEMQTIHRVSLRKVSLPVLFTMAALLAGCDGKSSDPAGAQAMMGPAPQVVVDTVQARDISLERVYAARTAGVRQTEVRARVEGILLKRGYVEGAHVKAGATLFQIDPEQFKLQAEIAAADLARAEAQFRQAKREWERYGPLFEQGVVSARTRDQALSQFELARAEVAVTKAKLEKAKLDLGYTTVKAPIGGATSLEVLPEGSLVSPQTVLTKIIQLDPIHVQFSLPEQDILSAGQSLKMATAELRLSDSETYGQSGVVDFTESVIDAQTGTVRARAVFPNPDGQLMPGQFVRVALTGVMLKNAIVIPEKAIAQSGAGTFVYVVAKDGTAEVRPVKLGATIEGGVVVAAGLSGGERVVVENIARVRPGGGVQIVSAGAPATAGN